MKKSVTICLSVAVILLLIFDIIIIFHNKAVTDLKKGYLVYSNHSTGTLCVYDVENSMKMTYSIDRFSNIKGVGKYYGGDFCCVGENEQSSNNEILLFKDGSLEKTIPISYKAFSSVACEQDIYFATKKKLYSIDKSSNECVFVDNIWSIPFINSKGIVAYLRNDTDLNSETDYYQNTLCVFNNGKIQEFGIVDQIICWLSEDEVLVRKTDTVIAQNGKDQTIKYNSENVIINISTKEKETTRMFDKTVLQASLSNDNTKAICWYPMDGSTDMMKLGIFDINNDKNYKSAIGTSSLNDISSTFVWLDENPMKQSEDGSKTGEHRGRFSD